MAFTLTIEGTIQDQHGSPVEGMLVVLRNSGGSNRGQDTTDAAGFYSIVISSDNNPSGSYRSDPTALAPHYSDPGQGPLYFWDAISNDTEVQNHTATLSNSNPTVTQIANQQYEEDTGNHTVDATMSDTDSGDVLTPMKTQGPSWGTLAKISGSTLRWTLNANTPAPGVYTFGYRVTDDWGGSSTTRTFDVEITGANDPPQITNPGTKQYQNNSGVQQFQVVATDPNPPLTYRKLAGEGWATINSSSGVVSVDTDAAARGTNFGFIWEVEDALGAKDDVLHSIEIINNPPVLTNPGTQTYERATGNQQFQLASTDADGDTPSYSKVSGPSWVSVVSSTGLVTADTDLATEGTHPVTWRVSDGQGGQDEETHNIVIGATDDAGFFQVIG